MIIIESVIKFYKAVCAQPPEIGVEPEHNKCVYNNNQLAQLFGILFTYTAVPSPVYLHPWRSFQGTRPPKMTLALSLSFGSSLEASPLAVDSYQSQEASARLLLVLAFCSGLELSRGEACPSFLRFISSQSSCVWPLGHSCSVPSFARAVSKFKIN